LTFILFVWGKVLQCWVDFVGKGMLFIEQNRVYQRNVLFSKSVALCNANN